MKTNIKLLESKIPKIMNFFKNPKVFKISAAISILIGLLGSIILEWSHVIYTLSMVSKFLGLNVSFTDLAMLMPESLSYEIFALEKILTPLFLITFGISLYAGFKRYKPLTMIVYGFITLTMFIVAFYVTPFVAFPAQHYTANFISVEEFSKSDFKDQKIGTGPSARNRAIVLEINGDARAYPISYITQTHIAGGELIGGEDVVMSFCGLSHLSVPYVNEVNGKKLDLRVMGQFNNNLVMFDRDTHEPIHQIKGKMMFSDSPLQELPSVIMDIDNFIKIYPEGKIFYRAPKDMSIIDKVMFSLMEYAMGEQYDESTDELAFDTSPYLDKRLGAKERIYAITKNGESIVFTKAFIAEKSNGYFELNIDGKTIAIKYFEDADYIDMFVGSDAREVNHLGILPDGTKLNKFRHINQMLWRVYQNFYPNSILYN
jgi:hypothetical protein